MTVREEQIDACSSMIASALHVRSMTIARHYPSREIFHDRPHRLTTINLQKRFGMERTPCSGAADAWQGWGRVLSQPPSVRNKSSKMCTGFHLFACMKALWAFAPDLD